MDLLASQCWQSSHEELSYGARSRPADREEPRKTVVRRRHQHHAIKAVSASAVSVSLATGLRVITFRLASALISTADLSLAFAGVVALRHVNEAASVFLTTGLRVVVTFRLASASISAADLVSLNLALAGVVALRHVNEPPLPADDWQPYGSTCVILKHQTRDGVAHSNVLSGMCTRVIGPPRWL